MKAEHLIQLTRPARETVSVQWVTKDGTARAGVDYKSAAGEVTFKPGETRKAIQIELIGRPQAVLSRYFDIDLSHPMNAAIADGSGRCTINPVGASDGSNALGPLVKNGLIANSYHNVEGRGGYFHHNSGTSEGQAVAIEGAFLAGDALKDVSPEAAKWYIALGLSMTDAMGDGSRVGAMLRQPFPKSVNEIALLHWLFAARGPIPSQAVRYDYPATVRNGKLVITDRAADVFRVFAIYPASSYLLYENPFSPAYDNENPGPETQIAIDKWSYVNGHVEIPVNVTGNWKIIYGYGKAGTIKQGEAEEAWPVWTKIADGYAACAPDTFRWFDLAIELAVKHDPRAAIGLRWTQLRDAMRRTAVRGQAITDLREVFKPVAGLPALPGSGEPSGMFCYSNHSAATLPPAGLNQSWSGYNFWSREADGSLLATVPAGNVGNQVQIGRGFNDSWREKTDYQEADRFLWVSLAVSAWTPGQKLYVYVSSTKAYNKDTRWYADLTELPAWENAVSVFASGGVVDFFIPISAFVRKDGDNEVLAAGTRLENFGISIENRFAYKARIRNLRLVSENTEAAKKGSKMPYFPGAMPFAINADTINQQFVGWNGSPFHGYQLPDHWLELVEDANAVHPGLKASDLATADPVTGALIYPIKPSTTNGTAKPKAALLMEQQLLFLKHAQQKWERDAGFSGPFAHTFVLNTPARMSIGNPTPHTWVYTNDDPNTRWAGYQVRVVESLAKGAWMGRYKPGFQDCRDMSAEMALVWLAWINGHWANLDGVLVDGKRIYGPPTDFDDPRLKPVQTLYEEPHVAAVVMRSAMWLKLALPSSAALCDALMLRCWNYLERLWVTEGPMRYTWSPNPETGEWFGFWHFEILTSFATLLTEGARPASIPEDKVRERMAQTYIWLKETGVK